MTVVLCSMLLLGKMVGALEIQKIEVNQALGVQKDNHHNFVAGKDTVIRVFLSEKVEIDDHYEKTWADMYRDGKKVTFQDPKDGDIPPLDYVKLKSDDGQTNVLDFACNTRAACGNWAAGKYTFEVSVNGVTKETDSYEFKERATLRVLAMPIKANYNGEVKHVPDDKWKTMWKFTAAVYPIAAENLKWNPRDELDASDKKYDLNTENGRREVWNALNAMMPATCKKTPTADGCYDLIVGFIPARPQDDEGELQGFTYGKPANIVVATDEDAPATVAHELAHIYGIADTYAGGAFRCDVNPAPEKFKGKDWDDDRKTISCDRQDKEALGDISATKIPAAHHPYEVAGSRSLRFARWLVAG